MNATAELVMKKPKGRPKLSERNDVTVKLDRALVSKAKIVAGHQGIPVAELLTDLLGPPLDRAYLQMVRELEGGG